MIGRFLPVLVAVAWAWLAAPAAAQVREPPVPAGLDPGGQMVVLLTTGIDYTRPDVAQVLARDGEGELIGWDFVDNDRRPFNADAAAAAPEWGGDGNALVRAIGRRGAVRVAPVRIDTADPRSLARAVAFATRTPAAVVVVPMWTDRPDAWAVLGGAIREAAGLMFVVAAGDGGRDIDRQPVWPAGFGHGNVLVVGSAGEGEPRPNVGPATIAMVVETPAGAQRPLGAAMATIVAADLLLRCRPHLAGRHKGEALKRAFLAEAAQPAPGCP